MCNSVRLDSMSSLEAEQKPWQQQFLCIREAKFSFQNDNGDDNDNDCDDD